MAETTDRRPVHNNKWPCCYRGTRLDGNKFRNMRIVRRCPHCFVWWRITYSDNLVVELPPFIKTTFERMEVEDE